MVPLHNFLHFIQGPVIPAAELEAQAPVGGQQWQTHKLQVESKMISGPISRHCVCHLSAPNHLNNIH